MPTVKSERERFTPDEMERREKRMAECYRLGVPLDSIKRRFRTHDAVIYAACEKHGVPRRAGRKGWA